MRSRLRVPAKYVEACWFADLRLPFETPGPANASVVCGIHVAAILAEGWKRAQIAAYLDGIALRGWYAVQPVDRQTNGELPRSGVRMRDQGTAGARAVAEIPTIPYCRGTLALCLRCHL